MIYLLFYIDNKRQISYTGISMNFYFGEVISNSRSSKNCLSTKFRMKMSFLNIQMSNMNLGFKFF